jgi:hypothetical protein
MKQNAGNLPKKSPERKERYALIMVTPRSTDESLNTNYRANRGLSRTKSIF